MKTKTLGKWAAIGAVLTLAAFQSPAEQSTSTAKPDKTYTGMVISVKPNENIVNVKGFLFSKRFNLGANCAYVMLGHPDGTIGDLRQGEKVKVVYQDAQGVLVADRVQQVPMNFTGMVKAIDPAMHTMTLHSGWTDKMFRIPDDCKVVLHDDRSGAIADIQAGDHVSVTYEIPNGKPTARQIAQTSQTYTGSLTAVDMGARTVKAKTLFGSKTFHLADNCTIVANGKPGRQMTDLKLGSRMEFNYDDVNGVNIVNRIGPTTSPAETETTSTQPMVAP